MVRLLSARKCFSKRRACRYSSRQRHNNAAFPAPIFGKECVTGGRKQRLAYITAEMQSSRQHDDPYLARLPQVRRVTPLPWSPYSTRQTVAVQGFRQWKSSKQYVGLCRI